MSEDAIAVSSASGCAMVVTDLDGTLLDNRGRLSARNRIMLEALGARGVIRVVATGRSLWSAERVLDASVPIDYLVFSSGAGIVGWPHGELLRARDMPAAHALAAAMHLAEADMDFMLHAATPDNHCFWYQDSGRSNADFRRRVERYEGFCQRWPDDGPGPGPFSQLLAIDEPTCTPRLETLCEVLAPLSVVRTTSPLDHASYWYEVFAEGVSKADGAAWLLARHGIAHERVLALGNDFNDQTMLDWAAEARVVANAPAPLRERFETVPDNEQHGFAAAVDAWCAQLEW